MKPVNEIRTATDRLGWSYQDLTKAEMEQLQQQISTNSETIANLIDQTLITSSGEEKDMIEG
jgi:hypothetical protein